VARTMPSASEGCRTAVPYACVSAGPMRYSVLPRSSSGISPVSAEAGRKVSCSVYCSRPQQRDKSCISCARVSGRTARAPVLEGKSLVKCSC
jgi:hypothetical protein